MFDDTDLSSYDLHAEAEGGELFPPTPPEYGWLVEILDAKKQDADGADTNVLFTGRIMAKSEWNGHLASLRLFLTSKFPDSDPKKKFNAFAHAAGIKGEITSTEQFQGRKLIVYFELTKDGHYTRAKKWWPHTTDNAGRVAVQPLPTWTGKPNKRGQNLATSAKTGN